MLKACSFLSALMLAGGVCLAQSSSSIADPANRPVPNARTSAAAPDNNLGAAVLSARVAPDGSLVSGSGATGSDLISSFTGNYEVFFTRDVSGCAYSVSPFGLKFFFDVQPRSGRPIGVFIHFQDPAGTDTNVGFYLTVVCGT